MAESDPPAEPKPVPVELAPAVPVAAVSLKLPPFLPNDPTLWFAQVEAQFLTRHITVQDTKFAYVVSSLQPDIAQEVRDLLVSPPAHERYNTLKKELIKRTSASEQKRLHQLLIAEELGDRKPSQLLRRMRQLLGENTLEDNILKQLFLQFPRDSCLHINRGEHRTAGRYRRQNRRGIGTNSVYSEHSCRCSFQP
ncbi:uncharacterized protein LOC119720950 [Patiria miniata]|uniref:DUF7041 domain-containing protein n=1 Tax=Patiria miniata TaxID=46514 RepID=A0A913Z7D4_PATMI|nr:uncharacterized protein LOC119720950 [Patiria miniata]